MFKNRLSTHDIHRGHFALCFDSAPQVWPNGAEIQRFCGGGELTPGRVSHTEFARICGIGAQEWAVANSLTRRPRSIWRSTPFGSEVSRQRASKISVFA